MCAIFIPPKFNANNALSFGHQPQRQCDADMSCCRPSAAPLLTRCGSVRSSCQCRFRQRCKRDDLLPGQVALQKALVIVGAIYRQIGSTKMVVILHVVRFTAISGRKQIVHLNRRLSSPYSAIAPCRLPSARSQRLSPLLCQRLNIKVCRFESCATFLRCRFYPFSYLLSRACCQIHPAGWRKITHRALFEFLRSSLVEECDEVFAALQRRVLCVFFRICPAYGRSQCEHGSAFATA